jgi:hypothetical protein
VVPWSNDAMVRLSRERGRGAVFNRPLLRYPPLNHGTNDAAGRVTCVGNRRTIVRVIGVRGGAVVMW